jgi:cytochrome c5
MELRRIRFSAFIIMVLAIGSALFSASKVAASDKKQTTTAAKTPVDYQAEGDRLFTANCSRCHMAPSSISPRVTGTLLMHMRVRARLSKRDEQILLKYMAP